MMLNGAEWRDGQAFYYHDAMPTEVGSTVVVEGVDPDGYNGEYEVVACATTVCVVDMPVDPGAYVAGGTIEVEEMPS